ncbi:alkyl/aryl-sulfatase [Streptomyces sp. LS1784]|uniref:alkyl/aryl-sulfatase n=1 Tax=Streptomyces sp. LS1784 TaxID=2851533 RepID=UPI001CCE04BB|nr:alkyl sulfatase dimerization domain-containing protein [Streptomyces sp. LS1784]
MPETPEYTEPVEPTPGIAEANRKVSEAVGAADEKDGRDFADAGRFLIAPPDVPVIYSRRDREKVVWDFTAYDFLTDSDPGSGPSTVNGSLWRQGQLTAIAGLFQVTSCRAYRIYQVRGYDLSNMTIVESDEGLIVIDPLACYETAQAALQLFRDKTELTKEQRPIKGVVYTHCHVDHFGGARGLFAELGDALEPDVPVVAPEGFLEHAVSENIYAGPAMARRAQYMYAAQLDKGPTGQVGSGLGLTISTGEVTLVPPTVYIGGPEHQPVPKTQWNDQAYVIPWRPGLYEYELAGVQLLFQLTPGTEAPAEMNIYLPDARALCIAENATHTMHNILSLRGAQVRDAHAWSKYLTEAIQTFGKETDVLFASHHWPMWAEVDESTEKLSNVRILEFLNKQRDMYGYLNDQTLRLINAGQTGIEIAEELKTLPPGLNDHWYDRGYYGSVSHNLKAVYQRYMGWYDANPAHLWELPPVQAGASYVQAMGGAEAVVAKAAEAYGKDTAQDFRWAAELLNHVVFGAADPDSGISATALQQAKELQAKVLTQLGYGAENGTWRNAYLVGAQEVVGGPQPAIISQSSADLIRSTTLEQYFSALARSVDGPTAAEQYRAPIVLDWVFTDETGAETGVRCTTTLRNGVLVFVDGGDRLVDVPDAVIRLTRKTLDELAERPGFKHNFDTAVADKVVLLEGDHAQEAADQVFGTLTLPDPQFPIVTP